MGLPPLRIEVLRKISGVELEDLPAPTRNR
jgi:hypothetical protein